MFKKYALIVLLLLIVCLQMGILVYDLWQNAFTEGTIGYILFHSPIVKAGFDLLHLKVWEDGSFRLFDFTGCLPHPIGICN